MNPIIDEILINEWWEHYLQSLGKVNLNLLPYRPDFMVISPAKTGTTWLFENLRCHREIFIPPQKEVRFFSHCWKWLDINWYLGQFKICGNYKKGDITPAYMTLPEKVIKLISKLMPELKIIFLMRDPVDRSWSQARHHYKYGQANFQNFNKDFDTIPGKKWLENFNLEGTLLYNDYYGSLKRWLKFFPEEQFYTGFYESIKKEPQKLLKDIFKFLNITEEVKWSEFPLTKKILSGIEREIPQNLKNYMASIYVKRTDTVAKFLKDKFNINIPSEWEYILNVPQTEETEIIEQINSLDDETIRLKKILLWWQEKNKVAFTVESNYKGFTIVIYMDKYYAFSETLGNIYIPGMDEKTLEKYEKEYKCVSASRIEEVKKKVDNIVLRQKRAL